MNKGKNHMALLKTRVDADLRYRSRGEQLSHSRRIAHERCRPQCVPAFLDPSPFLPAHRTTSCRLLLPPIALPGTGSGPRGDYRPPQYTRTHRTSGRRPSPPAACRGSILIKTSAASRLAAPFPSKTSLSHDQSVSFLSLTDSL
jgi:hypothetical protein